MLRFGVVLHGGLQSRELYATNNPKRINYKNPRDAFVSPIGGDKKFLKKKKRKFKIKKIMMLTGVIF